MYLNLFWEIQSERGETHSSSYTKALYLQIASLILNRGRHLIASIFNTLLDGQFQNQFNFLNSIFFAEQGSRSKVCNAFKMINKRISHIAFYIFFPPAYYTLKMASFDNILFSFLYFILSNVHNMKTTIIQRSLL